jgi:hypothetical protein
MAMARLGRVDVPRIAARRRDDCERERRADVRVSRIVGDPRITLLIVDQCQGPPTGDTLFKGDDAAWPLSAAAHAEAILQLQVSMGCPQLRVFPTSPDPWLSAESCGRFQQLGATYFAGFRNAAGPTGYQCRSICLARLQ